MSFDCANGLIEEFSDLSVTEIFKIGEYENHTIDFREHRQIFLKLALPFMPGCLLFWPQRLICYFEQWTALCKIERDRWMLRPALAITKGIQSNGVQPLPKSHNPDLACRKTSQRVIGPEKHILDDVFCIGCLACQTASKQIKPLLVGFNKSSKMGVQISS